MAVFVTFPLQKKKKVERTFEGFAQSADNPVPLFVELCTRFIEAKGLKKLLVHISVAAEENQK